MGDYEELLATIAQGREYAVSDADYKAEVVSGGEPLAIIGPYIKDLDMRDAKSRTVSFPKVEGITPVKYEPDSSGGKWVQSERPKWDSADGTIWLVANMIPMDILSTGVSNFDLIAENVRQMGIGFQDYRNQWLESVLASVSGAQTFGAASAGTLQVKDLLKAKAKLISKKRYAPEYIAFVHEEEATDLASDAVFYNAQMIYAATKGEILENIMVARVPKFGWVFQLPNATAGTARAFSPLHAIRTGHKIAFDVRMHKVNPILDELWAYEARVVTGVFADALVNITGA